MAAGPRLARGRRRAEPPRDRRRAGDPPGGRKRRRCGDRDQRRPGRRPARQLRHRRRRLLADLGRGRRPAGRAQRVRPRGLARGRGLPAGVGADGDPRARTALGHGPRRGPLVGRCARAVRATVAGRDPRPGHRAGTGRVPGHALLHRGGRGGRARDGRCARTGLRLLRGLPAARPRLAPGRTGAAPGPGRHPVDARGRRVRCLLRGRRGRPPGAPVRGPRRARDARRPPRARLDVGRADRHRLSRDASDEPPAEQLGHRRAGAALDPGAVRGASTGGVRPGRGDGPGVDPPRHRGGEAGDGRPRRPCDRPRLPRHPGRAPARSRLRRARWRRASTRGGRRTRRRRPTRAAAGRSTSRPSTRTGTP